MPTSTPGIKIDAVRRLGGSVELVGETYSETQTYAQVTHLTPLTSPFPGVSMCSNQLLVLCDHNDDDVGGQAGSLLMRITRGHPLLEAVPLV